MLKKSERGHQTHRREYEQTPLTVDHSMAMAEVVGTANGLSEAELRGFVLFLMIRPQSRRSKGWPNG